MDLLQKAIVTQPNAGTSPGAEWRGSQRDEENIIMTRNEILRARNQAMEPKIEETKKETKKTFNSNFLEMKAQFTGDNDEDESLEDFER
jgi:hypothetical protein